MDPRWSAIIGRAKRVWIASLAVAVASWLGIQGTQDAAANGDTRSLTIYHTHTKESATITFKRDGVYDSDGLKQLNWLLRDWRLDEQVRMEPRLFDIVWDVYREVGSQEPVHVVSAYRSPQTNAMLRRRSRAVAENSQHMAGRAMDFYLPDVSMSRVRELGMRLQRGGVGFYPNAFNPFVHLDAGSVRSWPRMSHDQLARLFPDGRTVHLPRDGRPLAGYEDAKADILAHGGAVAGTAYAEAGEESSGRQSLWAALFGGGGGGEDEDTDFYRSPASREPAGRTRTAAAETSASAGNSDAAILRGSELQPGPGRRVPAPVRTAATAQVASASTGGQLTGLDRLFGSEPLPTPDAIGATQPLDAALIPPPAASRTAGPLPPARPVGLAAASGAPLPPARPVLVAGLAFTGSPAAAAPPPVVYGATAWMSGDDRTALRTLFDAAAPRPAQARGADIRTARTQAKPLLETLRLDESGRTVLMAFSSADESDIDPSRFQGAAVVPLQTLP